MIVTIIVFISSPLKSVCSGASHKIPGDVRLFPKGHPIQVNELPSSVNLPVSIASNKIKN